MCAYFSLSLSSIMIVTTVTNVALFRYCWLVITFKTRLHIDLYIPRMYANQRVSLKLLPPLTTYYVWLCLTAYNEEKMVSYPNSELCNTLGDLRNRCKSTPINSSQIYPLLNHSIYDSVCNEKWSKLMNNLRELPGRMYIKSRICLFLFINIPWLLVTSL